MDELDRDDSDRQASTVEGAGTAAIDTHLEVGNRQTYAWGWAVASAIVNARFSDSALDALPVINPEHGWDRFLLTRRVSSDVFAGDSANRFGMIVLDGDDAPVITRPSGTPRLALGSLMATDPEQAKAQAVALFPSYGLPVDDLKGRWKDRRKIYPKIYQAIAELIGENDDMLAAREVAIDTTPIDGVYHPLYLHGVAQFPTISYDWFLVQWRDRAAFIRTHGYQAIYETDRGGWSTVKKQVGMDPSVEAIKQRIRGWLRIDAEPDPTLD